MVQLVEAPEHPGPMISEVRKPIAPVHGDENHDDCPPARHRTDPRQYEPREGPVDHGSEGERQRGHERDREGRIEHRVEEVLAVTASEERSPLRGAQPFDYEKDPDDRQGERTYLNDAKAC